MSRSDPPIANRNPDSSLFSTLRRQSQPRVTAKAGLRHRVGAAASGSPRFARDDGRRSRGLGITAKKTLPARDPRAGRRRGAGRMVFASSGPFSTIWKPYRIFRSDARKNSVKEKEPRHRQPDGVRARRFAPPPLRASTGGASARSSTDRASVFGTEGWEFESLRARQPSAPTASQCGAPRRGAEMAQARRRVRSCPKAWCNSGAMPISG